MISAVRSKNRMQMHMDHVLLLNLSLYHGKYDSKSSAKRTKRQLCNGNEKS